MGIITSAFCLAFFGVLWLAAFSAGLVLAAIAIALIVSILAALTGG